MKKTIFVAAALLLLAVAGWTQSVTDSTLNAAYHGSFEDFKSTIDACISKTDTEYLHRINSLLSENIQNFLNVRILADI
jgi:hypothetical protein